MFEELRALGLPAGGEPTVMENLKNLLNPP